MKLSTGNLILRAPEPNDVDFLFDLENDIKLWHVSQTFRPFSRFELEQYIFSQEKDPFKSGQIRFIIEVVSSGDIVGSIDLFDVDAFNKRAGVAIVILERYRNKGIASEALKILIDFSFRTLELHQLYCNIESENKASLKLFTGSGFEISGLKKDWNRYEGKWVDEYFLQLISVSP